MTETTDTRTHLDHPAAGPAAGPGEGQAAVHAAVHAEGHAEVHGGATRGALLRIADKIGRTRRPGAEADAPAGVAYLAQFVALDLDRPRGESEAARLDLGIVYGAGPERDAACYQVPADPGAPRILLRVGRARPKPSAPAWGALRDLPRVACPHLDSRACDGRTEVLVPDARTDSHLVLGQVHVLWSLLHNAVASRLADRTKPEAAFETARRLVRGVYGDVVRHDLFGTLLMPRFRDRYAAATPGLLGGTGLPAPREFIDGVRRVGHGLVREIYALNDTLEVVGLRTLLRQTSTGRPHDMPLTEAWLVDFSRFFDIGTPEPQRARAIGPHVARPFAASGAPGAGGAADSLVLRDLVACTRGGLRPVGSLISRAAGLEPRLFEGCFAGDERAWRGAVAEWLSDTGLGAGEIEGLAGDPPLTLFLMLEAEADTGGRTLGALGSVLTGETLAAALPAAEDERDAALAAARRAVFGTAVPATMAELVRFLQRVYRFPEGARLHPSEDAAPPAAGGAVPPARTHPGERTMFDAQNHSRQPISRIEVADYIELGRVVAQWATEPATRPATVAELRLQLDGIAVLPDRIKTIEFTQSALDHLVLALPAKEVVEDSLERVTDPLGETRYPLPQFYADHYRPGLGPVMTPLDTLLARVADYTIAQCR